MQPDTHEFEISDKIVESGNITSFILKPTNGLCPTFDPGSYLVFEVPAGDNGSSVKREYSISNWSGDHLRVTIKREDAPIGSTDIPSGLVSHYFHDQLKVDDRLTAFGPAGKFILDQTSSRPVILLGGGVGQTPLVAMAHALAEQGTRETWFIHACENGDVHALSDEIATLEKTFSLLNTHVCYANPTHTDRQKKSFDTEGFVTKELLQNLLPLDDYDVYLCGPGPFMQAMFETLLVLGIPEKRINYEFFGPATLLKSVGENSSSPALVQNSKVLEMNNELTVSFAKSGLDTIWNPEFENLLEFAEEHGVMADFSCRAGTCDSCKTILKSGKIEYSIEPMERPPEGSVLICCAKPSGNIVLDL